MIWLGIAAYLVVGALVAVEGAARIEVNSEDDHEWDRFDFVSVALAGLLWPLSLLAVAWFYGFEWRAGQLRKRADGTG